MDSTWNNRAASQKFAGTPIHIGVDYASQFPEAIPLHMVTRPQVAEELLKRRVGIPEEIITDLGISFMSHVMHSPCRVFQIQHLCMTVYHSQTNGSVE